MASDQQFCLRWNNHQSTLVSVFDNLLESQTLVDCTLAADGQYLKAHKVVLSACSPYLEAILCQNLDKHPILILKDVKFSELKAMLDYMYRGEVNISQEQLSTFLKAAESLQIKGLTDSGGGGNSERDRDLLKRQDLRKPQNQQPVPHIPQPRPVVPHPGLMERRSLPHFPPHIADMQPQSPRHAREGSTSPTARKRRRPNRPSSDDSNFVSTPNSLSENQPDTSDSCDIPVKQAVSSTPNVPNASTKAPETDSPRTTPQPQNNQNSEQKQQVTVKKEFSETLLTPKTEFDYGNDNSMEDVTYEDDEEEEVDLSKPGTSFAANSQGFPPWQMGGDGSNDDSNNMYSPDVTATTNQNNSQGGVEAYDTKSIKDLLWDEDFIKKYFFSDKYTATTANLNCSAVKPREDKPKPVKEQTRRKSSPSIEPSKCALNQTRTKSLSEPNETPSNIVSKSDNQLENGGLTINLQQLIDKATYKHMGSHLVAHPHVPKEILMNTSICGDQQSLANMASSGFSINQNPKLEKPEHKVQERTSGKFVYKQQSVFDLGYAEKNKANSTTDNVSDSPKLQNIPFKKPKNKVQSNIAYSSKQPSNFGPFGSGRSNDLIADARTYVNEFQNSPIKNNIQKMSTHIPVSEQSQANFAVSESSSFRETQNSPSTKVVNIAQGKCDFEPRLSNTEQSISDVHDQKDLTLVSNNGGVQASSHSVEVNVKQNSSENATKEHLIVGQDNRDISDHFNLANAWSSSRPTQFSPQKKQVKKTQGNVQFKPKKQSIFEPLNKTNETTNSNKVNRVINLDMPGTSSVKKFPLKKITKKCRCPKCTDILENNQNHTCRFQLKYKCPFCGFLGQKKQSVIDHRRVNHFGQRCKTASPKKNQSDPVPVNAILQCNACIKTFTTLRAMRRHVKQNCSQKTNYQQIQTYDKPGEPNSQGFGTAQVMKKLTNPIPKFKMPHVPEIPLKNCQLCSFVTPDTKELANHIIHVHNKEFLALSLNQKHANELTNSMLNVQ